MIRHYKGWDIVNTQYSNKALARERRYGYFDAIKRNHVFYAETLKEAKREIDIWVQHRDHIEEKSN
jgi:hypothetical protein